MSFLPYYTFFMKYKNILFIGFILCFSSLETYAQVNGGLMVNPKRIVFEDGETKKNITLINSSEETSVYTVSFTENRMNQDGSFTEITDPDPGQLFANPHLRIYPRRITLGPLETQTIMLQRRRKSNMQTGEYRSHLYFRPEIVETPLDINTIKSPALGISVDIKTVFGLSIPVIFRSGEVSLTTTLSDLKLKSVEGANSITLLINRKGNSSVYGDLTVEYYPLNGKSFRVAALNGLAVYTTIEKRYVNINLKVLPEMNLNEGTFKIKYSSRPGAKIQKVFAEAELSL
jgi:hypothetical protein